MGSNEVFKVLHLFCGLGGGALGFQRSRVDWRGVEGTFRTVAGVDFDAEACKDFEKLTGAPAYQADIAKMTGEELREICPEAPDVVFMSPPCKGFSGLMAAKTAATEKYQAMNRLVVQSIYLSALAWKKPPKLILLENVPRITSRGARLLFEVERVLHGLGYATNRDSHDCGELGCLAQHRKRFLLLARHKPQLPVFVYHPPRRRVRAIGEVLNDLPLPGDPASGPLHRIPRLQWKTWVRLALIRAGGDWRDLEEFAPRGPGGVDPRTSCDSRPNLLGVIPWEEPAKTITGSASVSGSNGAAAVQDPRVNKGRKPFNNVWKVVAWDEAAGAVTAGTGPSSSATCAADPRLGHRPRKGAWRIVPWDEAAPTVTSAARPGQSCAFGIQDPRVNLGQHHNKMRVEDWEKPAHTVTGSDRVGSGAPSVADPRLGCKPRKGTYGVIPWEEPAGTVMGAADVHAGKTAVADPRIPEDKERLDPPPVIISLDGTWHRPLTTMELAALQGLPTTVRGKPLALEGQADKRWRERIGNAVPPPAAHAIADSLLWSLIPAACGEDYVKMGGGVWVYPEPGGEPVFLEDDSGRSW